MDALELAEKIVECLDVVHTEHENWKRYGELLKQQKEKAAQVKAAKLGGTGGGLSSLIAQEDVKLESVPQPTPHPYLQGRTPSAYVLSVLRSARLADLTDALLTLPFEYAQRLVYMLAKILEEVSLVRQI